VKTTIRNGSRRSKPPSKSPKVYSRPAGIFRRAACSPRIRAEYSPGIRTSSRFFGGLPSLRKTLRNGSFTTEIDQDFNATITACSAPRRSGPETWLNPAMIAAYQALHAQGHAHSVETYSRGRLVGGLYGVHLGAVFFGESMFSRERDASKVAVARLVEECQKRGIRLVDCQVASAHLHSLGAREIPRAAFVRHLKQWVALKPAHWR
jgi:leucyl/phenylalanyl-tRNA---protein transferase